MRISSEQLIAGYPALEVREFMRRQRFTEFFADAAEFFLALSPRSAIIFLNKLAALGFIRELARSNGRRVFQVTSRGQALANASAGIPIHRRTAERALAQFLDRVRLVNSTAEYAYQVEHVVLFGSMLTDIERLGDVDVAIRLQPKVRGDHAFEQLSMARRRAAEANGRIFHGVLDWAMWPVQEVVLKLKARSSSLSLHDFAEVEKMENLKYRVLLGDPQEIAALIAGGRVV